MENVTLLRKDQNWESETTTYWFAIEGISNGVVERANYDTCVVDSSGVIVSDDRASLFINLVTDEMRKD